MSEHTLIISNSKCQKDGNVISLNFIKSYYLKRPECQQMTCNHQIAPTGTRLNKSNILSKYLYWLKESFYDKLGSFIEMFSFIFYMYFTRAQLISLNVVPTKLMYNCTPTTCSRLCYGIMKLDNNCMHINS